MRLKHSARRSRIARLQSRHLSQSLLARRSMTSVRRRAANLNRRQQRRIRLSPFRPRRRCSSRKHAMIRNTGRRRLRQRSARTGRRRLPVLPRRSGRLTNLCPIPLQRRQRPFRPKRTQSPRSAASPRRPRVISTSTSHPISTASLPVNSEPSSPVWTSRT